MCTLNVLFPIDLSVSLLLSWLSPMPELSKLPNHRVSLFCIDATTFQKSDPNSLAKKRTLFLQ